MAGNSFGTLFKITTFGESHGTAIGVVIDGCPSNLFIDTDFIAKELARRKPGQSKIVSQRKEEEKFEILSGVFEGKTTGAPLTCIIYNTDAKPEDYKHLEHTFRPSHADFTYAEKYGHRDYRGGGRSSARETACRVIAGCIAKFILKKSKIKIAAFVSQVGNIKLLKSLQELDFSNAESNIVRCPDELMAKKMIAEIERTRNKGDTIGGTITCVISGCPMGLGEPVFDKLHADLGKAMLSIPAVKGFEIGSGFGAAGMKGSEHNDRFISSPSPKDRSIRTLTNFSGGIQGGISNGEEIYFRVAFKPASTLMMDQKTLGKNKKEMVLKGKGRHDPCVVPRAVPVVDAMAAIVLADHFLRAKVSQI